MRMWHSICLVSMLVSLAHAACFWSNVRTSLLNKCLGYAVDQQSSLHIETSREKITATSLGSLPETDVYELPLRAVSRRVQPFKRGLLA